MDPPHTLSLGTQSTVNRGTYIFRQGHDIDLSSIIKIIRHAVLLYRWALTTICVRALHILSLLTQLLMTP